MPYRCDGAVAVAVAFAVACGTLMSRILNTQYYISLLLLLLQLRSLDPCFALCVMNNAINQDTELQEAGAVIRAVLFWCCTYGAIRNHTAWIFD